MKKSLFFVLAIVVMALTFGCQRNQTVNSFENEFGKDSCILITYVDSVECRYEMICDSVTGSLKMKDSYQKVFLSDIKKHGSFKEGRVTADIYKFCEGKYSDIIDIEDSIIRRIEFTDTQKWVNSPEITFSNFKNDLINVNIDDDFENLSKAPVAPVEESSFTITKSDFVIASGFFFFGFIVSAMIIIVVGEKRLREEQKKIDEEEV